MHKYITYNTSLVIPLVQMYSAVFVYLIKTNKLQLNYIFVNQSEPTKVLSTAINFRKETVIVIKRGVQYSEYAQSDETSEPECRDWILVCWEIWDICNFSSNISICHHCTAKDFCIIVHTTLKTLHFSVVHLAYLNFILLLHYFEKINLVFLRISILNEFRPENKQDYYFTPIILTQI